MRYEPFRMERWQSRYENQVRFNLSESGVLPLTLEELLSLVESDRREEGLGPIRLGYPQTNGSRLLRSRIADLYEGVGEAGVLVTSGGAEANFVALWHLLEPGGTVAALVPTYLQVPGLARSLGGKVLPVLLEEEKGWRPDLGRLRRALEAGARTILVTNPNNPTGSILDEPTMNAVVEAARTHDAWILADEVYRGAELDGEETPSFVGRYPKVLSTGSLSKAYGLPGLRVGWVVGPPDVIDDLWGRTDYTTIAPSALSDHLASLALEPGTRGRLLERTRSILRGNLELLADWAKGLPPGVRLLPPKAGAISLLRYEGVVSSSELAERIRAEEDVLVVPGDQFGIEGCLRVGFGEPGAHLSQGLARIAKVLAAPS